jgi:hypothetical protein
MQTYIILLIISLALIGFHINRTGNTPSVSTRIISAEKNENILNESENENILNENENENENEDIFNEMGDTLNSRNKMVSGKNIIDITTFKGEGLPSAKPSINPSSRVIDDNGLIENFGSYRDNFPYESSYLKTIKSENLYKSKKDVPINKVKSNSKLSKVILPRGINEYVEDFDFFKKTVKIGKNTINDSNKVLIIPHARIPLFEDKIVNSLPDEIVFKTVPDTSALLKERNNMQAFDKSMVLDEAIKKIDESKSVFNLK